MQTVGDWSNMQLENHLQKLPCDTYFGVTWIFTHIDLSFHETMNSPTGE